MNNKGWGLTYMLAFVCILFFGLTISAILYNKSFNSDNDSEVSSNNKIVEGMSLRDAIDDDTDESDEDDIIDINQKSDNDYKYLENNLKDAAINYIDTKNIKLGNYKIIISLDELKANGFIDELNDPENFSKCSGYVVYDGNQVNPFIKCIGTYQTDNYNKGFE